MVEVYVGKGAKRRKITFTSVDSLEELRAKLEAAVMIARGESEIEAESERREEELKVELLRAFSGESVITSREIREVMNEDMWHRPGVGRGTSEPVGKAKSKREVWKRRRGYDSKGNWLG